MFAFLKPAPDAPPLPAERVDPEYRRLRLQVFAGIFIGYAAYYLVRKNFALAMPDILAEHPEYTKAQLGSAMTGLSIAYGASKFLMGSVSDRSNPRWFMPLGLLLSCALMLVFGFVKEVYTSVFAMIALMTLNGWVNGMGWPPCGKTMVHWWSTRERGRVVALWNVAHNVGNGTAAPLALLGVTLFGTWTAKFSFNALVAAAIAIGIWFLLRDTPQSCGLPPVEQYKNDYPADYRHDHERTFTFREIFLEHVLPNKYLWAIAMANAFVYFVRYGVVDWIPTYLQTAKGFSFKQSTVAWALFEYAAIPGTILCGWMSDKVFKGRRAPATIVYMLATLVGVIVYALNGKGSALDRPGRADRDRLFHLRARDDHRTARARPRAEEGGGHGGGFHRLLRLRVRIGGGRDGRGLDRRPLGLERRVRHDGRLLPADDRVQRNDAGTQGAERIGTGLID